MKHERAAQRKAKVENEKEVEDKNNSNASKGFGSDNSQKAQKTAPSAVEDDDLSDAEVLRTR